MTKKIKLLLITVLLAFISCVSIAVVYAKYVATVPVNNGDFNLSIEGVQGGTGDVNIQFVEDGKGVYAIYSETDSSLCFYYGAKLSVGQYYKVTTTENGYKKVEAEEDGRIVTAIYEGFEDVEPTAFKDDNDSIPWYDYRTKFLKVEFIGGVFDNGEQRKIAPDYMFRWFYSFSKLTTIDGMEDCLDTSLVKSMHLMFSGCKELELTNENISNFNTEKVTNMNSMFYNCKKLPVNFNLSHFSTKSVTNLGSMFNGCDNLVTLDISGFSTDMKSVTGLRALGSVFYNCSNLKTIYTSGSFVNIASGISSGMFSGCDSLVGGNGTTLTTTNNTVDGTYARIDGENGNKGYFTDVRDKPANIV